MHFRHFILRWRNLRAILHTHRPRRGTGARQLLSTASRPIDSAAVCVRPAAPLFDREQQRDRNPQLRGRNATRTYRAVTAGNRSVQPVDHPLGKHDQAAAVLADGKVKTGPTPHMSLLGSPPARMAGLGADCQGCDRGLPQFATTSNRTRDVSNWHPIGCEPGRFAWLLIMPHCADCCRSFERMPNLHSERLRSE